MPCHFDLAADRAKRGSRIDGIGADVPPFSPLLVQIGHANAYTCVSIRANADEETGSILRTDDSSRYLCPDLSGRKHKPVAHLGIKKFSQRKLGPPLTARPTLAVEDHR